jgi:hypothetical protein
MRNGERVLMSAVLEVTFPRLSQGNYSVTSQRFKALMMTAGRFASV